MSAAHATAPRIQARFVGLLLVVLLGFACFAALLFRSELHQREGQALQEVSAGLARHIAQRWPELGDLTAAADNAGTARRARRDVIAMLQAVNPGVQVYLLDTTGRVVEYLGEPGMVRRHQIDPAPLRAFAAGAAALPLRAADPMGSDEKRLFSAAPLPPAPGQTASAGFLYVVLDGAPRQQAASRVGDGALWQQAGIVALAGLLLAAALGVWAVRRVAGPLEASFARMSSAVAERAASERALALAHRESMAALAHDLRTPLTALHGQLEALASALAPAGSVSAPERGVGRASPELQPVLDAALAQSERVRRLTQQLFELAALQAADAVPLRERFRLDELVADAVSKFHGTRRAADAASETAAATAARVVLAGTPPGVLAVEGDIQLVERALTNLIDNAQRHGRGPVRVELTAANGEAHVVVEDRGPGLPHELHTRLMNGEPLSLGTARVAASRSAAAGGRAGGFGGLGLAIAQRVAQLHGGSLRPLPPGKDAGHRICLALPLAA